ncbi:MAG: hypothetical protein U0269_17595 [Polyangiales bacterium]
MNELPHFARFARALALGAVAGSLAIAACSSSSTNDSTSNSTTTTSASSGNEQPATTDAGSTAPSQPTAPLANSACTTVGETRANPDERWSFCECSATSDGGSPTWLCGPPSMPISGPLLPPELHA